MKGEILKKLGIEPVSEESFQIFVASLKAILEYGDDLKSLTYWNAPVLPSLSKLESDEIKFIESEIQKTNLSIKESQVRVQKLIPQEERKKFAAYYTIEQGTEFMASVVKEFLRSRKEKIILADPFVGSGSTLTATIEKVGGENISKVWGIEPLPLASLVAYASLLRLMKGQKDAVTVIVGDAFVYIPEIFSPLIESELPRLPKADVILTNPPFTRWNYLEEEYRKYLLSTMERLGYEKYIIRKDASVQILSMFICDYILNNNGLIISVLPASTFYTISGRGYRSLLKEKYGVYAMVESKSRASFSEDSMFKEIILVAIEGFKKRPTMFIELNDKFEEAANIIMNEHVKSNITTVNLHTLPRFLDINLLALFGEDELRDIIVNLFEQGLKNGTLGYWDEILGKGNIIRGLEMYGPDFFFIPNRYWKVVEEKDNFVRIQNTNKELVLDRGFLLKALRKPSFYSHKIVAEVHTFMLSIPPVEINRLPDDLREYIKWGVNSGTANPAIKAFGEHWFSHVYKQMESKEAFGQIFIPDKVDLLFDDRGVFANYTEEKVAASKNFYIVRDKNGIPNKLLVGWFNSTIFISVLVLLGRKISNTWTRFLENDYLELPLINLNMDKGDEETASEIIEIVNRISNESLPPLWKQLDIEYRYKLDLSIAKFIGIKNPNRTIEDLYRSLNNLLSRTL